MAEAPWAFCSWMVMVEERGLSFSGNGNSPLSPGIHLAHSPPLLSTFRLTAFLPFLLPTCLSSLPHIYLPLCLPHCLCMQAWPSYISYYHTHALLLFLTSFWDTCMPAHLFYALSLYISSWVLHTDNMPFSLGTCAFPSFHHLLPFLCLCPPAPHHLLFILHTHCLHACLFLCLITVLCFLLHCILGLPLCLPSLHTFLSLCISLPTFLLHYMWQFDLWGVCAFADPFLPLSLPISGFVCLGLFPASLDRYCWTGLLLLHTFLHLHTLRLCTSTYHSRTPARCFTTHALLDF